MKHLPRTLLALLLLCALLCLPASAMVRATGDVNIRSGPGLKYAIVDAVTAGTLMDELGEAVTDERGIDWYSVVYGGRTGYVSSVYTEVVGEGAGAPLGDVKQYVELSGYYATDLEKAAEKLALNDFEIVVSEAPQRYYNASMAISGNVDCEHFEIFGPGYTLFGVAVGMDAEEARAKLEKAGLSDTGYASSSEFLFFEHPSKADPEVFDSCVNVFCAGGVVTELDWSTYTG